MTEAESAVSRKTRTVSAFYAGVGFGGAYPSIPCTNVFYTLLHDTSQPGNANHRDAPLSVPRMMANAPAALVLDAPWSEWPEQYLFGRLRIVGRLARRSARFAMVILDAAVVLWHRSERTPGALDGMECAAVMARPNAADPPAVVGHFPRIATASVLMGAAAIVLERRRHVRARRGGR